MAVSRRTTGKPADKIIKKPPKRSRKKPVAIRDLLGPDRVNALFEAAKSVDLSCSAVG